MPEDPFNGLGDVDPLGEMGQGGYRHPVTKKWLGKGPDALKAYNAALEELVEDSLQSGVTSGPQKPLKLPAARVVGVAGAAGALYHGVDEVRALGDAKEAARRGDAEKYYDSIGRAFGPGVELATRFWGRVRSRQVRRSRSGKSGNCAHMNDLAADGTRCGRRAASVRGPTRGYDPPRSKPSGPKGNCPYTNSIAADGKRCGRRAASVRGPTRGYDGI